MNISHLLNPVGSDSDQDILDSRQPISTPPEHKEHTLTDTHPHTSKSRKHANLDSVEQLGNFTTRNIQTSNLPNAYHSNIPNTIHKYNHTFDAPSSDFPNQSYNTHALWKSNQPPTPGEEPPGISLNNIPVIGRYNEREKEREQVVTQSGTKRKYTRKVSLSRLDTEDADVGSSSSSSSGKDNMVKSSIRQSQGQTTPESPDFQRQERESSEVVPRFERNADGKFRCSWPRCGKEFAIESRLSTHYRIHSGRPPYPCGYPGCNKAFHTSSSLSHHRVVHTDQNLRPFVCRHDRCGATYTQLARLITHQRTTHSGMILFIPQETSPPSSVSTPHIYPSTPSDNVLDIYTNPPSASATELRVLPAPVEFPQLLANWSSEPSHPTSTTMPRVQQQDKRPEGQPEQEREYSESRDMLLRNEAALTMASLREQGTDNSYQRKQH